MTFDRPVIILAAPRSGSTLLFETLSQLPDLYTIGGESHAVIEQIPECNIAMNGLFTNALGQAQATPQVCQVLRQRFANGLRDRHQVRPTSPSVRFLEKTPKNTLRVPFLNQVFPDALYIYLTRDPVNNISSIVEAWESGRFRTYPSLPGFDGKWSLLLPPGWQQLQGKPVPEIATFQWVACQEAVMQGLQAIPHERIVHVRYEDLIRSPKACVEQLAKFTELEIDQHITSYLDTPLPNSRYTVSQPDEHKAMERKAHIAECLLAHQKVVEQIQDLAYNQITIE